MKSKKIFIIIIFMLLIFPVFSGEIDKTASEVTQDVNGILFGFIEFLQWTITGVMLIIAILGIIPEIFSSGKPPDLAAVFMKFIQAAFIIGLTWAIGDFIFWIFGANINFNLVL